MVRLSQSAPTLQRRGGARIGRGTVLVAALSFVAGLTTMAVVAASNAVRLLNENGGGGGGVAAAGNAVAAPDAPPRRRTGSAPSAMDPAVDGAANAPDANAAVVAGKTTAFDPSTYINLPVNPETPEITRKVEAAMAKLPGEPRGLLHEARPPGKDAIMGLAAYPNNMGGFIAVVSTLRNAGYDGHIILGVHVDIPSKEAVFLQNNDVTFYAVEFVDCDKSILDAEDVKEAIRGKCSKGLEDLKLEWGRFEMARQWLHKCEECTGWAMVIDTHDIFFQAHPFEHLPDPATAEKELLFVEELAPHSNPKNATQPWRAATVRNHRYERHTEPCYGKRHWTEYGDRAILCSGTVIGTRPGMHRFLSVLVDEFRSNNAKGNRMCRSPHTTDQWTMNYLYYKGAFGGRSRTSTLPWGTGPVLTIGAPCMNEKIKHTPETPKHSQKDLLEFRPGDGLILNYWERGADGGAPGEGGGFRVAPAIHQEDRCWRWIKPWKREHRALFDTKDTEKTTYKKN